MSIPTLDEFLRSTAVWNLEHRGIYYQLRWHAYSAEYQPQGIWNWYLRLPKPQFTEADWKTLTPQREDGDIDYWKLPDLGAHGGWNYAVIEQSHRYGDVLVIGCDYNHSWDRDFDYRDGFTSVKLNAIEAIEELLNRFTPYLRCRWSGKYAPLTSGYLAKGGWFVLREFEQHFQEQGWTSWLPKEETNDDN